MYHESTSTLYQSILVPLDGSAFSGAALPVAAAFARRTGAELHLVTVYDPSAFLHFRAAGTGMQTFTPSTVDEQCRTMLASVEEAAASIANTGLKATGTLLEGTIVEALAEHADAVNADLVIMTTHGRSGLDRLRLGSVATSFLSRSPVPVFLVRPAGIDAPQPGHELPTGALLVPLDGSAFAESILRHADRFANAAGLLLELVTVGAPTAAQSNREYLERIASTIKFSRTPKITVLSESSPARALIDYAAETGPGAIAMATHGRSGIVRLVLGSVTEKVLTGANQPLLVYRPISDAPSA